MMAYGTTGPVVLAERPIIEQLVDDYEDRCNHQGESVFDNQPKKDTPRQVGTVELRGRYSVAVDVDQPAETRVELVNVELVVAYDLDEGESRRLTLLPDDWARVLALLVEIRAGGRL